METCDDEFVTAASDFIDASTSGRSRSSAGSTPRTCTSARTEAESLGQAGRWQSPYHDTMLDHDKNVGQLLDLLDELGIAEDTIVMYGTDNGPHMNTWPDGAMTPFRSEKNTNWEGAFRVPLLVRWPGKIPAGVVSNEIVQHHDWLPTFLAAAGEPDIVEKLQQGHEADEKTFKVHIDGYNLLPYLTGEEEQPAPGLHLLLGRRRPGGGALRQLEARVHGAAGPRHAGRVGRAIRPAARAEALQPAHRPIRACRHHVEHVLGLVPVEGVPDPGYAGARGGVPGTFKEFPPRQKAASFTIDQALEKMAAAGASEH